MLRIEMNEKTANAHTHLRKSFAMRIYGQTNVQMTSQNTTKKN